MVTENRSVGNNEKVLICMETTIFTGKKFRGNLVEDSKFTGGKKFC